MNASMEKDTLVIALSGHIDSGNAPAIESEIMQEREKHPHAGLTLDLRDLAYISSAGCGGASPAQAGERVQARQRLG